MITFVICVVTGVFLYKPLRKAAHQRSVARGRKALLAVMPEDKRDEDANQLGEGT